MHWRNSRMMSQPHIAGRNRGREAGEILKVLLVGPYPPPYGGIATTLFDLRGYLAKQKDCLVTVLNIGEQRTVSNVDCLSVRSKVAFLKHVRRFAREGYTIHLETNGHNAKS